MRKQKKTIILSVIFVILVILYFGILSMFVVEGRKAAMESNNVTNTRDERAITELISELTAHDNQFVNLKELTERFVTVDEAFGQTDWNLEQILANINMLVPVNLVREDKDA